MGKFSALLDACVIFPYSLCDTLLRTVEMELYQVYFSERILDEAIRNRIKSGRMNQVSADDFRAALMTAFPEALVEEAPAELEAKMENEPKDRHVLASAVYAKVDVIITSNLKDFPVSSLAPWNMEVMNPDDFLNHLCDENGDDVLRDIICRQAASYKKSFDKTRPNKKPPVTFLELLSVFEKEQPKFASRMLI